MALSKNIQHFCTFYFQNIQVHTFSHQNTQHRTDCTTQCPRYHTNKLLLKWRIHSQFCSEAKPSSLLVPGV